MSVRAVADWMRRLQSRLAGRSEASLQGPAKRGPAPRPVAIPPPHVPAPDWTTLDLDDPGIDWLSKHTRKGREPLGDVFRLGSEYYCRAVHRDKAHIARDLIGKGILDALVARRLIPRQEVLEIGHRDYAMLMRAEAAPWKLRVPRFPLSALKITALAWLDINRLLLGHGYGLIDGHYANFAMARGGVPVWVDIGSLVPLAEHAPMCGIGEFLRHFAYPLIALARKPRLLERRGKLLKPGGLTIEEVVALVGKESFEAGLSPEEQTCLSRPGKLSRDRVLEILSGLIGALNLRVPKGKWSEYHNDSALDRAAKPGRRPGDERNRVVLELLKKSAPREVLDVGANNGLHSVTLAARGYNVLGVDTDEFAIDSFYRWIRGHPELDIYAGVENFKWTAHSADTVVSLALTHHLAITAGIAFEDIAARYAAMARRTLIVEFMPNGLGGVRGVQPDPLPAGYHLETFTSALSRYFRSVEIVDYERPADRPPRTLILCTGRTTNPGAAPARA